MQDDVPTAPAASHPAEPVVKTFAERVNWVHILIAAAAVVFGAGIAAADAIAHVSTKAESAAAMHVHEQAPSAHPAMQAQIDSIDRRLAEHIAADAAEKWWVHTALRTQLEHQGLPVPPEPARLHPAGPASSPAAPLSSP